MVYHTAQQAHQQPDDRSDDHNPRFLHEARRNLTLLRAVYGRRSARYRRLLRIYRTVADSLGCRRRLECVVHMLRRQPRHGSMRWRPRPRLRPRSHCASFRHIVFLYRRDDSRGRGFHGWWRRPPLTSPA